MDLTVKKRRKQMTPERIGAVLVALPADEVQRIRRELGNAPPPPPPKTRKPLGRPPVSLTGKRFGKWLIGPRANKPGRVFYSCLCDCGNLGIVDAANLTRGQSRQCRQCADKDGARNLRRVRS